jgi:hypothetical protein
VGFLFPFKKKNHLISKVQCCVRGEIEIKRACDGSSNLQRNRRKLGEKLFLHHGRAIFIFFIHPQQAKRSCLEGTRREKKSVVTLRSKFSSPREKSRTKFDQNRMRNEWKKLPSHVFFFENWQRMTSPEAFRANQHEKKLTVGTLQLN